MLVLLFIKVAEQHLFRRVCREIVGRHDHLIQTVDDSVDYLVRVNKPVNVLQDTVSGHTHTQKLCSVWDSDAALDKNIY